MTASHRLIDMKRGHPSTSILPVTQLDEAASKVLRSQDPQDDSYGVDRQHLHYGPDGDNHHIRTGLGQWLGEKYGTDPVRRYGSPGSPPPAQ